MDDHDSYTRYAIGVIKSAKLESCNLDSQQLLKVHEPTLVIHTMIKDMVHSETTGWTERPREPTNVRLRFKIPLQDLETPKHCKVWVKRSLESAHVKCVASETGNPKTICKELIWNLREKWVSGEICIGVIEMDVTRVTELRETHRRWVMEMWGNSNAKLFKGATSEESNTCCAICLDVLDEKSVALELQCRHVFHSECIMAWLTRKRICPSCRSSVQIKCGFWVQKKKSHHTGSTSTAY